MRDVRKTCPSAPWFDKVLVRAGDRRSARRWRRELLAGPPPEIFGIKDGPRSEFEDGVIVTGVAAVRSLLDRLGFPGRPVAAERVHLLTPEAYRDAIGPDGPDGMTLYGHVYLQRDDDPARLIHSVTHELVHQAAYLSLEVSESRDEATGDIVHQANARRGGLVTFSSGRPDRPHFQGLNEGVTELIAHDVRKTFIGLSGALEETIKEKLVCFWAYSYLCLLTAHLIRRAAGGDMDRLPTQRLLYRDYFLGTSSFLKKLRRSDPRAPSILRRLDASLEGAIAAAEMLGFPELADRLARRTRK